MAIKKKVRRKPADDSFAEAQAAVNADFMEKLPSNSDRYESPPEVDQAILDQQESAKKFMSAQEYQDWLKMDNEGKKAFSEEVMRKRRRGVRVNSDWAIDRSRGV